MVAVLLPGLDKLYYLNHKPGPKEKTHPVICHPPVVHQISEVDP